MRILHVPPVALVPLAALFFGACVPASDCSVDTDCGAARVCTGAGRCAQCDDNGDCAADSFCCAGECHGAGDVTRFCGCGPALSGNPGADCTAVAEDAACLVGDALAIPTTVAQGACGCGCTTDEGGPVCGAPLEAGGAPVCSCADNIDCRGPSVDVNGRPHGATDTCSPDARCVCFGTAAPQTACDPDSFAPDCTGTGCQSLGDDIDNCGVLGRDCSEEGQGLNDGSGLCVDGGCACDNEGDCVGRGLNVDQCAFFGAATRCACAGYTANGDAAACPLALPCVAGGCLLDGTARATQDALLAALNVAN